MLVMSLFQDENSRIFIVATYEPLAREIICEVCIDYDTVIHIYSGISLIRTPMGQKKCRC